MFSKLMKPGDQGNGSEVKSTVRFFRGPEINSQQLHDGSQPSYSWLTPNMALAIFLEPC